MRKPRRFPKRGYTDSMTSHQVLLALSLMAKGSVAVLLLYVAKLIAPRVMRWVPVGRLRRLLLIRLNERG